MRDNSIFWRLDDVRIFRNRAPARDILKKSPFVYRCSIKKIQGLAFKLLFVGGSIPNWSHSDFRKSYSRAWHPQNSIFSFQITRKFDFFDVWMMFVSSKISLSLETASKFRRFIFIKIDQICAPVRSIRKNFHHLWMMMSRVSTPILHQMNVVRGGSLGLMGGYLRELSGFGSV